MADLTSRTVHTDEFLSTVSVAFVQSQADYIASQVFPIVNVEKQSDKYYTFPVNDWMRDEAQKRAPNTESEGGSWTISSDNYYADVWAYHHDLNDQYLANADAAINVEANAARLVATKMLLRKEKQFFTDYFATSIWGTDKTVTTLWSDAGADPIDDVDEAIETIHESTGFEPNTLVMSQKVFRALKNNPDIIDRIKYTSSENVTTGLLARMFNVDRILVSKARIATNVKGETEATEVMAGRSALLLYVPPSAGLETPSAGYTFAWDGVSDGAGLSVGTVRIEMPLKRSVRIESQMAWDNKVVSAALGYFLPNVVAA